MKICAVSDYHYNSNRKQEILLHAKLISDMRPDVFIYGGDLAQRANLDLEKCLRILGRVKAKQKLFVAGNHDIYTGRDNFVRHGKEILAERLKNIRKESNLSLLRYRNVLKLMVQKHGFHYLDGGPKIIGDVGFVGSMGWYDYSMKPGTVRDDVHFLQEGVSGKLKWHQLDRKHFSRKYLVLVEEDLPQAEIQQRISKLFSDKKSLKLISEDQFANMASSGTTSTDYYRLLVARHLLKYSDNTNVFLGMTDDEFLSERLSKIQAGIDLVNHRCRVIVFASHMLQFKEGMIENPDDVKMCFRAVYNGSRAIGGLLLRYKKIKFALHGHNINTQREYRIGNIKCLNMHYRNNSNPVMIEI